MQRAQRRPIAVSFSLALLCSVAPAHAQDTTFIARIPCHDLGQLSVSGQRWADPSGRPFGIPLRNWTPAAFTALSNRILACGGPDARTTAAYLIRIIESGVRIRAESLASAENTRRLRKQSFMDELAAIMARAATTSPTTVLRQLEAFQRKVAGAHFPAADQHELETAIAQHASSLETRLQDDVARLAREDRVRLTEDQARIRTTAAAQAEAEAKRRTQATESAEAEVNERQRALTARLHADAEARQKIEDARKAQAEAGRHKEAARKAISEAAERERRAREQLQALEAREKEAAAAQERAERELKERQQHLQTRPILPSADPSLPSSQAED